MRTIPHMALRRARRASRGIVGVNGTVAFLLLGGWAVATGASFLLADATRFLDMPLGAFMAGQGALLGVVIVGVRVSGADRR